MVNLCTGSQYSEKVIKMGADSEVEILNLMSFVKLCRDPSNAIKKNFVNNSTLKSLTPGVQIITALNYTHCAIYQVL